MKGRGRYALNGAAVQTFAECQSLLDSRDSVILSNLMYLCGCVGIDRTLQLAYLRSCRRIFVSYPKQCCVPAFKLYCQYITQ
jgi:hypothetical protein